jgi:Domain of unknown function (DUF1707)
MNDHIRVSDADRERVAEQLRDQYAEGRLSADELDERITVTLSAKTVAELRRVTADLPGPEPAAGPAGPGGPGPGRAAPPWGGRPWGGRGFAGRRHRGPRFLPVLLLLLIAALVIPGAGFLLVAFVKIVLLFWLVALVAGLFAAARFRRHARRHWRSGPGSQWGGRWDGPRGGWQD